MGNAWHFQIRVWYMDALRHTTKTNIEVTP